MCKRYLRLTFMMLSAFGMITGGASQSAWAQEPYELDPSEFLSYVRDTDSANLKDYLKKIRAKKTDLSRSSNNEELRSKKEELEKEKVKVEVVRDLQSKFIGRLDSTDELQTLLQKAFEKPEVKAALEEFNKEVKQHEADLQDPDKKSKATEVKPVVTKVDFDKSPVSLVASIETDAHNKPVLRLGVTTDESHYLNWNSNVQRKLSTSDVEKTVEEINPRIFGRTQELVNFDPANAAASVGSSVRLANLKVVKPAQEELEKLRKEVLPENTESRSYQLKEELDELKDTQGRREELQNLEVNRKVAEWLRDHSPGEMTECEILQKAVGLEQLPTRTKENCVREDPKLRALAASKDKEDGKSEKSGRSIGGDDAAGKPNRKLSADEEKSLADVYRSCLSAYRMRMAQSEANNMNNVQQLLQQMQAQMSAQMQNDPLTKALDKIVNGAPSVLLAKMIDKGPLGLPLDPMLTNFPAKARNVLETNYPVSNMNREQYRELEGEAGTLDQVHAVVTMSIERIDRALNSPQAMAMSPLERQNLIQQRQELTSYQAAAGSMSEAIRQQLAQRRDLNYQQGMGYSTAGVPIVGGSGANAGWRSVGTPNPNANSVRRTTSPRTQSTGSSRQFVR